MHIVTTSDNNYVSGVLTLIASAFRHNPAARFSVLAVDWHAENAARLDALAARLGCSIRMIVVDAEKLADLPVRRAHLSVAAFARLLIAELMPDAGRLIYMDADMLVTGALDEGHETPLAPQELLAAVPCPSPRDAALRNLDLAREDYFNSGFLVIDTDVWREHNLGQACIMRLAEDTGRYVSEDESALNDVCRNRYRKLPSGLNFYAQETAFQPALNDPASIRVIHYVTAPKPWQGPTPLDTLWHHEAAKIADLLPPPPPAPIQPRTALSRINGTRKVWVGWALRREKYRDSFRIRTFLRDRLIPGYLADGSFARVAPPRPAFRNPA